MPQFSIYCDFSKDVEAQEATDERHGLYVEYFDHDGRGVKVNLIKSLEIALKNWSGGMYYRTFVLGDVHMLTHGETYQGFDGLL
jgi:hypothetical protein